MAKKRHTVIVQYTIEVEEEVEGKYGTKASNGSAIRDASYAIPEKAWDVAMQVTGVQIIEELIPVPVEQPAHETLPEVQAATDTENDIPL
jgi:hypothetical protein